MFDPIDFGEGPGAEEPLDVVGVTNFFPNG